MEWPFTLVLWVAPLVPKASSLSYNSVPVLSPFHHYLVRLTEWVGPRPLFLALFVCVCFYFFFGLPFHPVFVVVPVVPKSYIMAMYECQVLFDIVLWDWLQWAGSCCRFLSLFCFVLFFFPVEGKVGNPSPFLFCVCGMVCARVRLWISPLLVIPNPWTFDPSLLS